MSLNDKKFVIVSVVFAVFFICLTIWFYTLKDKMTEVVDKLTQDLVEQKMELADASASRALALDSENRFLGIDVEKSFLDSITFVLRLHDDICLGCYVENLISLRKKLGDDSGGINLLVLGSYNFLSQLKDILIELDMQNFKYINVADRHILPADSLRMPYLFVLNKNKMVQQVYVLLKKDPDSIDRYLLSIKRKQSDFGQ